MVRNTYNSLGAFFARRKDCGFAFTPTAGTQLSVGPRCDFDLHLDMSFLQPTVTRWSYGLGLGNGVSVAWFLCDSSNSSIWFRRFTISDSPSLLQGKRCLFLVAFASRTDCGFAFTPTAGSQLSVGPRYDFDLHLYMFYLHLAVATFTRWVVGDSPQSR